MNFLLELKFFILSHPVTSKQPHKIVQIHMRHPVIFYETDHISLHNVYHTATASRPPFECGSAGSTA